MRTVVAMLQGREVLITFPNYRQYGHLGLEILFGYAEARRRRVPVYFHVPREHRHRAMLQLDPEGIEVVRPGHLSRLWLDCAAWADDAAQRGREWTRRLREEMRTDARLEIERWMERSDGSPFEGELKRVKGYLKQPFPWETDDEQEGESGYYFHRRWFREPVPTRLTDAALASARRQAAAFGITDDVRLVTIHAREAGYKFGREVQDFKPGSRDDSTRNVRIESYFPAIDDLVAHGFTVVRMGDPTMTPVNRPGVIDLAISPGRTDLLELYCLMRSTLLLGSDSGPSVVAYLTNTPLVCTNCTDPIPTYPIRRDSIYLLKTVRDRRTGRRLSLQDMLSEEYTVNSRNSQMYQYTDNSAEHIRDAVAEMLRMIAGEDELTALQRRFKDTLLEVEPGYRAQHGYIRKWGADDGFIGDGRIAASFVERHWS